MASPSKSKARQEWATIGIRKKPYHNQVRAWAKERDITMAEMIERIITTYAAMLGGNGE